MRLILDNTTDYGFAIADLEGQITEWEGGCSAVTGWVAGEALESQSASSLHRRIVTLESQIQRCGAPHLKVALSTDDGTRTKAENAFSPMASWSVYETAMVNSRGTRRYSGTQLRNTASHLNSRLFENGSVRPPMTCANCVADLSEANRRKTEFLAVLAHEPRNPLAPIQNGLAILKLGDDAPVSKSKARDMMERQLHHLVSLVDDLLDVARSLRKTPDLEQTVLIALTGWRSADGRDRSKNAGFDQHLTKPARPALLERLFRSLDDASRSARPPATT